MKKFFTAATFAVALGAASPAFAISGQVTVLVVDNSCAYFELGSSGPYYTIGASDANYQALFSLLTTAAVSGQPLTIGATNGTICGNLHVTSIYIGVEY